MRYDLHTHTTYSDGSDAREMARAAEDAGLDGVGFTDHCIVHEDPYGRSDRYDFHRRYEDRREDVEALRDAVGIDVFDGVELTYDPAYESEIAAFLAEADFDYAIGSVHYVDGCNVAHPDDLTDAPRATRRAAVETYVDWQVRLVESGLFDVLGHLDVTQRSPVLRGLFRGSDYRRLADALASAGVSPEINAGRLLTEYGHVHPHPDSLSIFADAGVEFVVGSDAHSPDQICDRRDALDELLDELPVDVVDLPVDR